MITPSSAPAIDPGHVAVPAPARPAGLVPNSAVEPAPAESTSTSNAAPASPESADSAFENEVSRIMQELTSGSATAPSNESLIDQAASEYFNQLIDFEALIEPTEDVTAVDGDNEAVSE